MRTWLTLAMIPIAAFVAAAVLVGWMKGGKLHERQRVALQSQGEWRRLQAEHARLEGRLAGLAAQRQAGPRPAPVPREIGRATAEPSGPALVVGEWLPSTAWRNEGRGTPRAMVSTLLWAAAGGDLRMWREMLEFDEASNRRASELFVRIAPEVRGQYGSPEDLVASFAMTRVPLTEAQLMWLRETDADHAIAGLRLANADGLAAAVPPKVEAVPAPPPQLPEANRDRMVVLNLHRAAAGWQVVVPVAAIDSLAGQLGAPLAKQ